MAGWKKQSFQDENNVFDLVTANGGVRILPTKLLSLGGITIKESSTDVLFIEDTSGDNMLTLSGTSNSTLTAVAGELHLNSSTSSVNFECSANSTFNFKENGGSNIVSIDTNKNAITYVTGIDHTVATGNMLLSVSGGQIYLKDKSNVPSLSYVPSGTNSVINKKYNDEYGHEGTSIISTGEAGGTKFLREDGDGTCSWQTPAGGGTAKETFTFMKRFTVLSSTSKWVGGYRDNYYKSSEVFGLGTTVSSGDYTYTGASSWATFSYSDYTVANACTITKFTCSGYQNTTDCDIIVGLWKMTPGATTSHTANATVDFIGSIEFTANADTSTMHATQTLTSFQGSGTSLAAGDCICVFGTLGTAAGTDRSYWWLTGAIEVEYS